MTRLYAQPYDISATGFYFSTMEEYDMAYKANRNDYGEQPEEYEIQFIDGENIDASLFQAIRIYQSNVADFLEKIEEWDEWEKYILIIAAGECGYTFDMGNDDPNDFDVDIYHVSSICELAEQFVEEGLFGDIPKNLEFYIDYDAIAQDLAVDYSETCIDGTNIVYRCS